MRNASGVKVTEIPQGDGALVSDGSIPIFSIGTTGEILTSNGENKHPSFKPPGNAPTTTNLLNGAAGDMVYQSAPSTTAFVSGTGVLVSNGTTPSFSSATAGQVLTATGAGSVPTFQSTGLVSSTFFPTSTITGGTGTITETFTQGWMQTIGAHSIVSLHYDGTMNGGAGTNFQINIPWTNTAPYSYVVKLYNEGGILEGRILSGSKAIGIGYMNTSNLFIPTAWNDTDSFTINCSFTVPFI